MSDVPQPAVPPPAPPKPKKKNQAWIWYFAFLLIASVGVVWFMIWFNWSIQLTPVQLEEARKRWSDKGPNDYKLVYTKQLNDDPKKHRFVVTVRAGKVEEVLMNGQPLEREQRAYHSMDRIFHDIERFMNLDAKPNQPQVYVTAIFDDQTGAVRRYVRRVMGSTQRVEMHILVEPLPK